EGEDRGRGRRAALRPPPQGWGGRGGVLRRALLSSAHRRAGRGGGRARGGGLPCRQAGVDRPGTRGPRARLAAGRPRDGGGGRAVTDGWRACVLASLAAPTTVSLATVADGRPWAATVFYANVGTDLYFLSEPKTRHCTNILASGVVAATINEDYRDWQQIK